MKSKRSKTDEYQVASFAFLWKLERIWIRVCSTYAFEDQAEGAERTEEYSIAMLLLRINLYINITKFRRENDYLPTVFTQALAYILPITRPSRPFLFNQFIPAGAVTQTLQKTMIVVGPQKTKVLQYTVT